MPVLALLWLCAAPLVATQAAGEGLTLVRVEGPLDVGTQSLLRRGVDEAKSRGDWLVLDLDTPGGEVELMWQLGKALLEASEEGTPTVAWVHDRALSAGAFLVLSCQRVYMRSHATIGSALPVQIGPGGLMPAGEDEEVREKISSSLRGEFRGMAQKHGRPPLLAEAMVDPDLGVIEVRVRGETRFVSDVELDDLRKGEDPVEFVRTVVAHGDLLNATGSEAVELGLADGLAESIDELAAKLGLSGARREVERARSDDLAAWLYTLSPLFLVAGFVLLYLELKAPGFGLPGALALVCFGVVLFGRHLVGLADIPHVLLIVGGAALLAVELFLLPGTLWLGLLGAVAIVGGLIWSFVGSGVGLEHELDRVILVEETFRVVAAGAVAVLIVLGLARVLPHTPGLSRAVLMPEGRATGSAMSESGGAHASAARVGARGRALTALRPVGRVALEGARMLEYEARAEGAEIAAGTPVQVVEVQPSGRLIVAPGGERT